MPYQAKDLSSNLTYTLEFNYFLTTQIIPAFQTIIIGQKLLIVQCGSQVFPFHPFSHY